MKKAMLLSAVAAVGLVAASVNAAVITVTTGPIAAYNNSTQFTPVPFNPTLNPATTGVLYEIPVNFQLAGLAAGQSFGNISFDVTVGGSAHIDPVGYGPSAETFLSGKTPVNYYGGNSDAGSDTTDLKNIVAYFPAGAAAAPRAAAGVGSAFNIGFLYIDLPAGATENGTVTVNVTQYSLNDNGTLTVQPNNGIVQPEAVTFVVPEPATLSTLCLGGLALVARRRRA